MFRGDIAKTFHRRRINALTAVVCIITLVFTSGFTSCLKSKPQVLKPSGPIVQTPPLISFRGEAASVEPSKDPPPEKVNGALETANRNPRDPKAQNDAGVMMDAAGDPQHAIEFVERGAGLDPRNPTISYNLARIMYELGRIEEALNKIREVLSWEPRFAEARIFLVIIYIGKQDYNSAQDALQGLLKDNPDSIEGKIAQGVILIALDKEKEAILIFEQVKGLAPNNAIVLYDLGVAHQEIENLENAEKFYREAIEKDPNLAEAHNNLGTVLAQNDKQEESFVEFHKASELNTNDSAITSNLSGAAHEESASADKIAGDWLDEGGTTRIWGTIQGQYVSIPVPIQSGGNIKFSKIGEGEYRFDESAGGVSASTNFRLQPNGSYQGPAPIPPGMLPPEVNAQGTITFWVRGDVIFGDISGSATGPAGSIQLASNWRARRKK